jgi:hypothetical protein
MPSDEGSSMFLSACALLLVKWRKTENSWWQRALSVRRETQKAGTALINAPTLDDGACFNS